MIFAPNRRHAAGGELRELRLIAAHDEQRLAVGREQHRVRPVLAAAPLKRPQHFRFVELAVAVGVARRDKAPNRGC